MSVLRAVALVLLSVAIACSPSSQSEIDKTRDAESSTVSTSSPRTAERVKPDEGTYLEAQEAWRAERAQGLQEGDSWLSLVGLEWLEMGESTFGSSADNTIVLPPSAPAHAGSVVRDPRGVRLKPVNNLGVVVDGEAATEVDLVADADGDPTLVEMGSTSFFLIRREDKIGLRIRDSESRGLREFSGLDWYPVDPSYRVEAKFKPHSETGAKNTLKIPNVIGQILDTPSPGKLEFEIDGKTVELAPIRYEGTDEFFVIFGDATNGESTYGAGRFLYAGLPDDNGTVILDFNQAYSPPCAYTDFATCPLAPRRNRLKVAIKAGEKNYPGGHS